MSTSKLPKWTVLKANFPALKLDDVCKVVGGKVKVNCDAKIFTNVCTVRVSKALNAAGPGHAIPFIKGQTSSGKDKKWYIFRVTEMKKYLAGKYGKPERVKVAGYKKKLKSRKGIIIYDVESWTDATGHADLWNGANCEYKCYGSVASKIYFWEAR